MFEESSEPLPVFSESHPAAAALSSKNFQKKVNMKVYEQTLAAFALLEMDGEETEHYVLGYN